MKQWESVSNVSSSSVPVSSRSKVKTAGIIKLVDVLEILPTVAMGLKLESPREAISSAVAAAIEGCSVYFSDYFN